MRLLLCGTAPTGVHPAAAMDGGACPAGLPEKRRRPPKPDRV